MYVLHPDCLEAFVFWPLGPLEEETLRFFSLELTSDAVFRSKTQHENHIGIL